MSPFLLFVILVLFQTADLSTVSDIPRISESHIEETTTYFNITDFRFEGAQALTSAIEDAHYVSLGELHNRVKLGELTQTLLNHLKPHGYNHFAIETGPYSAL